MSSERAAPHRKAHEWAAFHISGSRAVRMANKRIMLLSDGTGAGKVRQTNVWRTFESLDLTSSQLIAF